MVQSDTLFKSLYFDHTIELSYSIASSGQFVIDCKFILLEAQCSHESGSVVTLIEPALD